MKAARAVRPVALQEAVDSQHDEEGDERELGPQSSRVTMSISAGKTMG